MIPTIQRRRTFTSAKAWIRVVGVALALLTAPGLALAQPRSSFSSTPTSAASKPGSDASANWKASGSTSDAKQIGDQVREALKEGIDPKKRPVLTVEAASMEQSVPKYAVGTGKAKKPSMPAGTRVVKSSTETIHVPPGAIPNPLASRQSIRARAAALAGHAIADEAPPQIGGDLHWSYAGSNGPQAWGKLQPDFVLCAKGTRQSPINIQDADTLQGPAEPILFRNTPSGGSVVNNGHTIQVDVEGDNAIVVRGSEFKLLQFHFHHPSEERINSQGFAMVAHLVHRNAEGQLAVVAVLLQPGPANPVINKVWTYLPLDTNDRVRLPAGVLDIAQLLPKDQRYYQFLGSLTTPPCAEGVLWLVLKQPVTLSPEQLHLFAQLFPNNARPVQPVNGRAVRNAR